MVELFLDAKALLGESPRWNAADNCLYWADIEARRIHRTDFISRKDKFIEFDEQVGCFALSRSGGLIIALENGFRYMPKWQAAARPFGDPILADLPHQRFNDGCIDPYGRLWVGTVTSDKSQADAALYRLSPDGSVQKMLGGLLTSNGAAFTQDGHFFYHADTPTHNIRRFAYHAAAGTIGEPTLFHQFPFGQGRPDGAALDQQGCYWSALFDGGSIVRLSPDGALLKSIAIPTQRPTMIAFGGGDGKTAFVTSATKGLDANARLAQPHAGGIFMFQTDVAGQQQWLFDL